MIEKNELDALMAQAREMSWNRFGKTVSFHVPGMFVCHGTRGKYPAISITGPECDLQCEHCKGTLLAPMISAPSADELLTACRKLEEQGKLGCLISGGSSCAGKLPWKEYAPVIRQIKDETSLRISVHAGFLDEENARILADAGVDQALIDVVGDDATLHDIFHLDFGCERVEQALDSLYGAGLDVVPHIIVGLNYGKVTGEYRALQMLAKHQPKTLVFVVLMPLPGTPLYKVDSPPAEEVAEIMAKARLQLPETVMSLGCARPRGPRGEQIERYAVDCGINKMALYSEEVLEHAKNYGLEFDFHKTCCSVDKSNRSC